MIDIRGGTHGGNTNNHLHCVVCETSTGNLYPGNDSIAWSCYLSKLEYIDNLYCFGYRSCYDAIMNNVDHVECNGYAACADSVITSSTSVLCTNGKYDDGYQGRICSGTSFTDVDHVICNSTGMYNCFESKHGNTNNMYDVQCYYDDLYKKCSNMTCGHSTGSFTMCNDVYTTTMITTTGYTPQQTV